jgi:hypothetical protein
MKVTTQEWKTNQVQSFTLYVGQKMQAAVDLQ